MKTIITSTANNITAPFDKRFGRAEWICVYDNSTDEVQFFENTDADLGQGAGTKLAARVSELGAAKVISGDFGPKAKDLLDKLNIQMVILDEGNLSIEDIINRLEKRN